MPYKYGSFSEMGHPPPKETKKGGCSPRSFLIPAFCTLLAVVITAFVTWHIARGAYAPKDRFSFATPAPRVDDGPAASDLLLPTSAHPINYDLQIKTYLPGYGYKLSTHNLTFEGQVTVQLNITQTVKKITLNSFNLIYNATKCQFLIGTKNIPIAKLETSDLYQKVFIHLEEAVEPTEKALLKLDYRGDLRTDMTGFYQTTYTNSKGEVKMAAVTQMEPTYARRMVPCFDEPAFKATWKVRVLHPSGTVAVANGAEEGGVEKIGEDFLLTQFISTPKMSSYLLAIFISEFEFNEGTTKSGTKFRVWSRPEEKNSTQYAVTAGVRCLEFYEEYYKIKFPLAKQDMVALPDFSAGAMENWGLITYRENSLLYDPRIYPGSQKRRVAVVIAHELAHQWFGNLVTLKWWNDLWLNEGFATLVEYLGTDEISDGNFRMREWFTMDALWTALDADSIASTHPMTFKIEKAMDVMESFDSITYDKGGSVMAMLRKTIGEEHFNEGITHYLTRHQYGNAEAADLFAALADKLPDSVLGPDGTKLNITTFADPWTKQLGYPLLKAKRLNSTHVQVDQERFKMLETAKEDEKYSNPKWGFKWDVPVWYQVAGSPEISFAWMKMKEPLIIRSEQPIILNAESNGFYRAGYSEEMWAEIVKMMNENHEKFSTLTRVRLIDDAFAQARARLLNYSIPMQLISYLSREKDYLPWSGTLAKIREMTDMYGTDPEKEIVHKFTIALAAKSPAKKDVDFVAKNYLDDTKFFDVLAAQGLILNSCAMGDQQCSATFQKLFDEQVDSKCDSSRILSECSQIAAPFRSEAYCQAVRNGNGDTFEKVLHWYKTERNQVEKGHLMNALGCSNNVMTLQKLLLDAMKPEGSSFRLQDCGSLFQKVCANEAAAEMMLNFLIKRWDEMNVRLSHDHSIFSRIIAAIVGTIKTEESLEMLREFRSKHANSNDYDWRKMEESVEVAIVWRKNNLKFVTQLAEELTKNI